MFHSEKSLWPCDHDNPWAQRTWALTASGGTVSDKESTPQKKNWWTWLKNLKECWTVSARNPWNLMKSCCQLTQLSWLWRNLCFLCCQPRIQMQGSSVLIQLILQDIPEQLHENPINIWVCLKKVYLKFDGLSWFIIILAFFTRAHLCMIYIYKYLCATFLDKPWQTHIWKSCHNAFWYILMMQDVKKLRQGLTADGVRSPCDLNQPLQRSYHFQPSCGRKQCQKHVFSFFWIDLWLMGIPLID